MVTPAPFASPARLRFSAALCVLWLVAACATVPASTPMPTGEEVRPPVAFLSFCYRHPRTCQVTIDDPAPVRLTAAAFEELGDVNRHVNIETRYLSDQAQYGKLEYWDHPHAGAGDCEDIAIEKQRRLADRGWPLGALLLARVRTRAATTHCVLVVVTDRGDYVLDTGRQPWPTPWRELPYEWIMRQSRHAYRNWVAVGG